MRAGRRTLVIRRARHQRLILATTVATALVAISVLATLATYTAAAPDAGRRAALLAAPPSSTGVTISTAYGAAGLDTLDQVVRGAAADAFAGLPASVYLTAQSIGYDVAPRAGHASAEIAELVYLDEVAGHADLVDGRWPEDGAGAGSPIQVAVPTAVATALDVTVGTTTRLTNRLSGGPVDVLVTGVYRARDPDAAFWLAEPFHNTGVRQLSFTTYGPLLVTRTAFAAHLADSATVSWQVVPDFRAATAAQITASARRIPAMRSSVTGAPGFGSSATFTTTLDDVVSAQQRAAMVSRSALSIPLCLLVILATCALLLATRMVAEFRRGETALMRARGASTMQLIGHALGEGVLLVIPAAALAAIVTTTAIRLIARAPFFTSIGVQLRATPQAATWTALALGSLLCLVSVVLPWLRNPDSYLAASPEPGRRSQAGVPRAGLDLALAALAGLAYWQLHTLGSSGGRHASDPLLVIAPALLMLAGAALAVRVLPFVAGLGERIALRSSGLTVVVSAAQVARRPNRYSGVVLLVTLALAAGTLSTVYDATWRAAQRDQADYQVGADLRLMSPLAHGAVGPLGQAAAYQQLPGVDAVLPAVRDVSNADKDRPVTVLGVDTDVAPDVMMWRGDLRPSSVADILAPLARERAEVPGAPLPAGARGLEVDAELTLTPGASTEAADVQGLEMELSAMVTDSAGVLHVVGLGTLTSNTGARALSADLAALPGGIGTTTYAPLSLAGFVLRYPPMGFALPPLLELRMDAARVSGTSAGPSGAHLDLPADLHWSAAALADVRGTDPPTVREVASTPGGWVAATVGTGVSTSWTPNSRDRLVLTLGMPLPGSELPGASGGRQLQPVAGIVTRGLLKAGSSAVGDVITVPFRGGQLPVRIVGVAGALPTVPAAGDGVLVDLRTLSIASFLATGAPVTPSEWWLATSSGSTSEAHQVLAGDPTLAAAVLDRHALATAASHDPFAAGARGALVMGFAAAAVFAAIGFAVNAAITARERRPEFALLRALGASPRQLGRVIAIEQAIVVGLAALVGLALGTLAAWGVLPLVIVGTDAGRAVPQVALTLPWVPLALLIAGTGVALGAVIAALVRGARRVAAGAAPELGAGR